MADPRPVETDVHRLQRGDGPVLFSVPHAGTELPPWLAEGMNDAARSLPDTDWYVDRLVDFAPGRSQSLLVARKTRYLIDLNRPTSDENLYPGQATTGLCPVVQFDGEPIYRAGREPDAEEVRRRVQVWWRPYHECVQQELDRIRERHGHAVLFDCHSICSRVPRLFEGTLPVLNLGTNHRRSCHRSLEGAVAEVLEESGLSLAVNGRFVGGTITRTYGRPDREVHALQIEMGWDGYLSGGAWDEAKAARLQGVLQSVSEVLEAWRPRGQRP